MSSRFVLVAASESLCGGQHCPSLISQIPGVACQLAVYASAGSCRLLFDFSPFFSFFPVLFSLPFRDSHKLSFPLLLEPNFICFLFHAFNRDFLGDKGVKSSRFVCKRRQRCRLLHPSFQAEKAWTRRNNSGGVWVRSVTESSNTVQYTAQLFNYKAICHIPLQHRIFNDQVICFKVHSFLIRSDSLIYRE